MSEELELDLRSEGLIRANPVWRWEQMERRMKGSPLGVVEPPGA